MKSLLIASVLIISSFVSANINLGPAYKIKIPGSEEWKYVKKYTKDPVFVEGLEFSDDTTLIESAGGWSGSKVQKIEVDHTHKKSISKRSQNLPQNYFGEGCTLFNGKIFMMTYTERKVFVYDPMTLK
jgi:glutaminyl-peptide cyclotransferase